jgi:thiol-disulfide isomerase/thioredoxin
MSRLCGPIFGIVALFATITTAAESVKETASTAPVVAGASAIQPVSLNLAASLKSSSLKSSNAKADPAKPAEDTTGKNSRSVPKIEETSKTKPAEDTKSNKSDQAGQLKEKGEEKPKALKPLKRRVVVVKATWCGACQSLKSEWPKLKKVRWRIGSADTDHFQVIDTDEDLGVVSRYGVTQLPTLLLIEDGKVIDRAGVLNAKNLAEFYYGRL